MISPAQLVWGVEWVWLVWLVSILVVLKLSVQALRRWRRPCWAELARGEEGVSYSLSYVMVFPFYLMFLCLVFETTWLLVAKVGTMYAAHAGARSAVVWSSAQPANLRTTRINQAVWTAMTPFVTGSPSWQNLPSDAPLQAGEYVAAYKLYNTGNNDKYAQASPAILAALATRYLTAATRTTWMPQQFDNVPANGPLTVTVTYRAPLHIPGVSKFLDPDGQLPYEYPITSSATLPSEAPANATKFLGIHYKSR